MPRKKKRGFLLTNPWYIFKFLRLGSEKNATENSLQQLQGEHKKGRKEKERLVGEKEVLCGEIVATNERIKKLSNVKITIFLQFLFFFLPQNFFFSFSTILFRKIMLFPTSFICVNKNILLKKRNITYKLQ